MAVRVGVSLLLKGVVSIIHRHRFALQQHLMAGSASVTLTDASATLTPPTLVAHSAPLWRHLFISPAEEALLTDIRFFSHQNVFGAVWRQVQPPPPLLSPPPLSPNMAPGPSYTNCHHCSTAPWQSVSPTRNLNPHRHPLLAGIRHISRLIYS